MTQITLSPSSLTKEAFAPFGDVIETRGSEHFSINSGTTERFHDLSSIDVMAAGGRPLISVFRGQPRQYPLQIAMMERHPLASQAFVPLTDRPFLVVVGEPGVMPDPQRLRAFITDGTQGVNYRRGVWHHPLLVIGEEADFLVVDRGGPGENCDEHLFNLHTETISLVL